MVERVRFMVPTVQNQNEKMVISLDHFIYKEKNIHIKTVQENVAILYFSHSKTEQNGHHWGPLNATKSSIETPKK